MRVKLAALAIAIASILLLPSCVKADTFTYNVTSTLDNLDVTFNLPTFQESFTISTFTENTSSIGALAQFSISANSSAGCSASNGFLSVEYPSGPCMIGVSATGNFDLATRIVPGFFGTGIASVEQAASGIETTVAITDVPSGMPEPSSLLLLGCGLFGLLVSFGSRSRYFQTT